MKLFFLGWFLGIFSHIVLDYNKDCKNKKNLTKLLKTELMFLREPLVTTRILICQNLNKITYDFLKWVKDVDCLESSAINESITKLLGSDKKKFDELSKSLFPTRSNSALGLKKTGISSIDRVLERASLFDDDILIHAIDIKSDINVLNQEVELAMQSFQLSFSPSTNHLMVSHNIKSSYDMVDNRLEIIVNKIQKLIAIL